MPSSPSKRLQRHSFSNDSPARLYPARRTERWIPHSSAVDKTKTEKTNVRRGENIAVQQHTLTSTTAALAEPVRARLDEGARSRRIGDRTWMSLSPEGPHNLRRRFLCLADASFLLGEKHGHHRHAFSFPSCLFTRTSR